MRKHVLMMCTLLLMIPSAWASSDNTPTIAMDIRPVNIASDILYFPGPVPLQFALTVTNPTNEPVTLQGLNVQSVGPGAFSVRSGPVSVNRTIPAGGSATLTLSTWGRAHGGYMRAEEPVTLRAIGTFRSPSHHTFIRMINQNLTP